MKDHFFENHVLVFDLDNTLILRDDAMLKCIEKLFHLQLTSSQKKEIQLKDEVGYSDRILFCKWLQVFLQIPFSEEEIWQKIRTNIGHFVRLNKFAKEVLSQLQEKYHLVLLTNGGTQNQLNKIRTTSLTDFFLPEKIFISESLGYSKPDSKIFQLIEKQFSLDTQFCMIGDHWGNDIIGAQKMGWKALYLNLKSKETTFENVRTISSLLEIKQALNEFRF